MKLYYELEQSVQQNQKYTQDLLQVALKEALEPIYWKRKEDIYRAEELISWQNDKNIKLLYHKHKNNPQIKWKESIKKVVDIKIPTQSGLDE